LKETLSIDVETAAFPVRNANNAPCQYKQGKSIYPDVLEPCREQLGVSTNRRLNGVYRSVYDLAGILD